MSSWLDTKRYVASLAKSAISEAQKTLDKALDIDEEAEENRIREQQQKQQRPGDGEHQPGDRTQREQDGGRRHQEQQERALTTSMSTDFSQWGSFTGSFFPAVNEEPPKKKPSPKPSKKTMKTSESEPVSLQPQSMTTSNLLLKTVDVSVTEANDSALMSEVSEDEVNLQTEAAFTSEECDTSSETTTTAKPTTITSDQTTAQQSTSTTSAMSTMSKPSLSISNSVESNTVVNEDLASSMSSSRTTVASSGMAAERSVEDSIVSSTNAKIDTTLTEEDQEALMEDALRSSKNTSPSNEKRSEASSSSKSYEVLKLETLSISGHTSGDDVEVITSSDIEVISSPSENGRHAAAHFPGGIKSPGKPGSGRLYRKDEVSKKLQFSDEIVLDEDDFNVDRLFEHEHDLDEVEAVQAPGSPGADDNTIVEGGGMDDFADEITDAEIDNVLTNSVPEAVEEILEQPQVEQITETCSDVNEVIEHYSKAVEQELAEAEDGGKLELTEGHFRTGSEVSAASEESSTTNNPEVDRLLKKISELSEILEARETKLVEMSKNNHELQEKNVDLTSQVKEAMKINAKLNEANLASEEFTQRLATMEKKLQQTASERDKLKDEVKALKKDNSTRVAQSEFQEIIAEKDEIITDLRQEGETLSKQVGKHSEVIKKLRSKEKASDKDIKNLKSQLEDKTKECERLNKSLDAKNDIETKQIEAIQNLTTANSQWEEANKKMASELEDANEKVNGLKLSLEGAYKEMAEMRRGLLEKEGEAQELALQKETSAKQALHDQLREQQEAARQEADRLLRQIDELREALAAEERSATRSEERMRREREELMLRLQESEARHEELTGSVSASTRPLLRQIESLQASLSEAQANSDRAERSLTERLQQASVQLASAQERERNAAEQYRQISSKTAGLESKLTTITKSKSEVDAKLEAANVRIRDLEQGQSKEQTVAEAMKRSLGKEIEDLKKNLEITKAEVDNLKEELSGEKRKNVALVDQLRDRDRRLKELSSDLENARTNSTSMARGKSNSPSFSAGPPSVASDSVWPDEVFESRGLGGGYDSLRVLTGGVPASSSAILENLQSALKQKESQIVGTQMEVARLEKVKSNLTSELGRLSAEAEKVADLEERLESLTAAYKETEEKYQTMLTMYGEKVEETEELKLDLQDVKAMYKEQIEDLLRRQSTK